MKKIILMLVVLTSFAIKTNAQTYISPEQAYWNAFNQSTNRLYNTAQKVQRFSNGIVNYGSRTQGAKGVILRNGYNQAQRFVQRNVRLPRRYYPN